MKRGVVVDASAALMLVLDEPGAPAVYEQLAAWRRAATPLYVPSYFWLEIANAVLVGRRMPAAMAFEIVQRLDDFGLETAEITRPLLLLAIHHAERHGLTTYDSAYLALAETLDVPLYSADTRLLAAAGDRAHPASSRRSQLSELPAPYGSSSTWPAYGELSAFLASLRVKARNHAARVPGRTAQP